MTSLQQYDKILGDCKSLFTKKINDYGPSWKILRPSSLTDQIYIKAKRIRSIQEKKVNKVGESIEGEFIAMVNYGIIALIQIDTPNIFLSDMNSTECIQAYEHIATDIRTLFGNKNHDYGEAWRDMRISSMTDLILMKILRIKQIEDNDGITLISEGIGSNYQDIVNYSIFCLILMDEEKQNKI